MDYSLSTRLNASYIPRLSDMLIHLSHLTHPARHSMLSFRELLLKMEPPVPRNSLYHAGSVNSGYSGYHWDVIPTIFNF